MIKILKIFSIVLCSLVLLSSKVLAAPTYVDAFSISNEEGHVHGLAFSSDGTVVYIVGHGADRVYQYPLDTAWDITSANSQTGSLNTPGAEDSPSDHRDIKFNTDGTRLFVLDRTASQDRVYQWSLSTAWDVTTGSYTTGNYFDIEDQDSKSNGFAFSPDGTKMFVLGQNNAKVFQYSLTTSFDITTAAYTGNSFGISSAGSNPEGLEFSSDGTQMFVAGYSNRTIYQYPLTTAWDITTASYTTGDSYYLTEVSHPEELVFSSDGSKMFLVDKGGDDISEFTLSCYYGVINCIDPKSDKDDVASVESQTESAKQLIQHTTYPVLNRMEWLRRNSNSGNLTNQNIKFQFSNPILASLSNLIIPASLSSNNSSSAELQSGNWSYWSEGTVSVGKIGDSITSSAKNINTTAITIGADKKTDNGRMFGAALRLGNDDIDFGNVKDSLGIDAVSLTLYESRLHGEGTFIDGIDSLIGIGAFKTDIVNAVGSSSTEGTRDGKQIFSSFKIRETFKKNELFNNNNKKFKKSRKSKKNKQTDFNFVKFDLHIIQNEYPQVLKEWDIDFDKTYLYEEYIKLFYKLDKRDNLYPLLSTLPISTYVYTDEDEGYVYVNEDVGSEKLTSINSAKKIKNNLGGSFYSKIDLGFTSLSDYSENGSANLKFDRQDIGTIITSIGGAVDNSANLRSGTFKPFFEIDYYADISPSSEQKISYISDTGSTYTLSNINSSTHNFKSKLGFDFTTDAGWNLTSSYQRTQSTGGGYSDALYFGANYITSRNTEYAMSLDNNKAILDYKRNINGFDITFGSNYGLMSAISDYGAKLEISNKF